MNVAYVIQRILLTLIVVFGITFVVFMIVHIVPGDPARVVLGPYATDETVNAIRERLGLNRPFLDPYISWLSHALRGDLGSSLLTAQPVVPQLIQRLAPTFELGGASLLIGMLIAFPVGIISAVK